MVDVAGAVLVLESLRSDLALLGEDVADRASLLEAVGDALALLRD